MKIPIPLKQNCWRSDVVRRAFSLSVAGWLAASAMAQAQVERTWVGTTNHEFGTVTNWSPSGGVNGNDLIIDQSGLSLVLNLAASGSKAPRSILIKNSATGFEIATSLSNYLTITDNLTLEANTTATFNVRLLMATPTSSSMTFNVGAGSVLTTNQAISANSVNGTFRKSGAGKLIINSDSGTIQTGVTYAFDAGEVELNKQLSILSNLVTSNLGTSSTQATLSGNGTLYANLTTAGASQSVFNPSGELTVWNLDLSEGAAFTFELGSDLIKGNDLTLGGPLVFNLTGGVEGESYEVFSYTGEVDGFSADQFLINGPGYAGAVWSLDGGVVSVQLIPEPSVAALGGVFLLSCWLVRKSRQRKQGLSLTFAARD